MFSLMCVWINSWTNSGVAGDLRRHDAHCDDNFRDHPNWKNFLAIKDCSFIEVLFIFMMTSSNGNIFRVTGHLCGEFTGPRWITAKGQWRGALMFSLICVWINGWVNNGEAGDLRRYRAHYDVAVMWHHHHQPQKYRYDGSKPFMLTKYQNRWAV